MRIVDLNGDMMTSIEAAHRYLKERLHFPEYYGGNLDALWDILSTASEPVHIKLINSNMLENSLGGYAEALLSVFSDAALENENIHFEIV